MNTMTYPIGTKFTRATGPRATRKRRTEETVVDVHTTTNAAGEVVSVRYVCTHEFCGQTVTDYDVPTATIGRALAAEGVVVLS